MRIFITPEDIIKRGLWDIYTYYILGSEKSAEEVLKLNSEFELSEREGIVIGLLKVMETDNLIYRFNDYLVHFLNTKSFKFEDDVYIKKKNLDISIEKFKNKFPDYWQPDKRWKKSISDMSEYIENLKLQILNLETKQLEIMNNTYDCYYSNNVKKLLNFNNY